MPERQMHIYIQQPFYSSYSCFNRQNTRRPHQDRTQWYTTTWLADRVRDSSINDCEVSVYVEV